MRAMTKKFLRENLLGLSLTLMGVGLLALAGVLYLGHHTYGQFALAEGAGLDGPDIDVLVQQNKAYERIAKSVTPAIVAIQSTQVIKVQQSPFSSDPFFRQFFGDMFPQVPREQRERALGSGVIVSPDGYILTNNHVIAHATTIEVTMSDHRVLKGKVVGADSMTDVAVIKVDGKGLPTVPFGDSNTLHVGDTVMAFGNPFGLYFTVTRGTVSALGRAGGAGQIEQIQNFIQTDAAINPGNSGGALVNSRGELVGINTAILSGNGGGNQGIGFAIPVNLARNIMDQIIRNGKVVRGYLGASIQDVTPALAKVFGIPKPEGAVVSDVSADGPAENAGIKQGDVITAVNGQPVSGPNALRLRIAETAPGTVVRLQIWRNRQQRDIAVKLGELPEKNERASLDGAAAPTALAGLQVDDLTPQVARALRLPGDTRGVVVTAVAEDSPAADAGLQHGDVIQQINRQPVANVRDFNRIAGRVGKDPVLLLVNRGGTAAFVTLENS